MNTSIQNNNLPTDEEKLHVASTFLNAVKSNDWNSLQTILAPDATWTLPGTSVLSGLAASAEAIVKRAQGLKSFGVNFQLQYVLCGLHGFTLSLHNTASRGDLLLDEQVAIVCQVSEGKVISMATYLSDVAGINEFFVPGIID